MIIETKPSFLRRFGEFWAIYRAYRAHHSVSYSLRMAHSLIYGSLPF